MEEITEFRILLIIQFTIVLVAILFMATMDLLLSVIMAPLFLAIWIIDIQLARLRLKQLRGD